MKALVCILPSGLSSVYENLITNLHGAESIKDAAATVAHNLMSWYKGNETGMAQGLLPQPYYWWLAGAMFGQMIEYWFYTGDETYNAVVTQAMLAQVGPKNDYMPPNQTKTEVNFLLKPPAKADHVHPRLLTPKQGQ